MGISLKQADAFVADLLADQLAQLFANTDVIDLSLTFDPEDTKDAKIAGQIDKANTMLAEAQDDYELAKTEKDESGMDRANAQILAMENLVKRYSDTAFGYFVRADGKETVLKGSLLDRVMKAVNDLNTRTVWLGGKSIRVNAIDYDNHTLKVVKSDRKVRTRILRPTMESIITQCDAAFPKVETDSETA